MTLRAENLDAKARRREDRKETGNIGAIIVRISLARADVRLKLGDYRAAILDFRPVIPAKAGMTGGGGRRWDARERLIAAAP